MEWISALREEGIALRTEVSGRELTTFGSGGSADCVVLPASTAKLRAALALFGAYGVPHDVIGGGSNLLFPDEGYRGALIRLTAFDSLRREGAEIVAGAGVKLVRLSRFAAECALTGAEFACGIPGEVGGAVRGNAGAFGQSISDGLREIEVLTKGGRIERLAASEIAMTEHSTDLSDGVIVLSARFALRKGDGAEIEARMREMTEKRRSTQPHRPSAGSVFRRVGETPAALLIERTGLKGMRIGGAELSKVHCNFIVNDGTATTKDFFDLAECVRERVRALTGATLEYEVKRLCSTTEN